MRIRTMAMTALVGLVGFGSQAVAQSVEDRIASLEAEVAQLRQQQSESWMDARRTEEVKTIVREVLADAQTRASLSGAAFTAGHDGDHFFLASGDGGFLLELSGHFQLRYVANFADDNPDNNMFNADGEWVGEVDEFESGFTMRRLKLQGEGHIVSPNIRYAFSLADNRDTQNNDVGTFFEDYYVEYEFDNGLVLRGGRYKQPFARQNLVSSKRQMTVDRSPVLEAFNVDRSEGVMASYQRDAWRVFAAVNDGIDGESEDWNADDTNFGLTARGEFLAMGTWSQFKDFSAWSTDAAGLMLGAAVHYEIAETGTRGSAGSLDNVLLWTVDGSYEANGLGAFVAVYGMHSEFQRMANGETDADVFGLDLQLGYMIVPDKVEPYVAYGIVFDDDDVLAAGEEDQVSVVTLGVNVYQKKHNSKLSFDLVWGLDPLRNTINTSDGLGLRRDDPGQDDQVALRAQYQLAW